MKLSSRNVLTFLALLCGAAAADTLFVSPGGNGTECSSASPCELSYACSYITSDGVIEVASGSYSLSKTCNVDASGVQIMGPSAGAESANIDCTHACFNATAPFTISNLQLAAVENDAHQQPLIIMEGRVADGDGPSLSLSATNITALVNKSNFVNVQVTGASTSNATASVVFSDVTLSGSCQLGTTCIYIGSTDIPVDVSFDGGSFTDLSAFGLLTVSQLSVTEAPISLSFTDHTLNNVSCSFIMPFFTGDMALTNFSVQKSSISDAAFSMTKSNLEASDISLTDVSSDGTFFYFIDVFLTVSDVTVSGCTFGLGRPVISMQLQDLLSAEVAITGVTITDTSCGYFLGAKRGTLASESALMDVSVTDITITSSTMQAVFYLLGINFSLKTFSLDNDTLLGTEDETEAPNPNVYNLARMYNPRSTTITDGTVAATARNPFFVIEGVADDEDPVTHSTVSFTSISFDQCDSPGLFLIYPASTLEWDVAITNCTFAPKDGTVFDNVVDCEVAYGSGTPVTVEVTDCECDSPTTFLLKDKAYYNDGGCDMQVDSASTCSKEERQILLAFGIVASVSCIVLSALAIVVAVIARKKKLDTKAEYDILDDFQSP